MAASDLAMSDGLVCGSLRDDRARRARPEGLDADERLVADDRQARVSTARGTAKGMTLTVATIWRAFDHLVIGARSPVSGFHAGG